MVRDGIGVEPSKLVLAPVPDQQQTGVKRDTSAPVPALNSQKDPNPTDNNPTSHGTRPTGSPQYRSIRRYIQTQGLDIELPPVATTTTRPSPIIKIPAPVPPSTRKQSYILQRIAMQQDCVDDEANDTVF